MGTLVSASANKKYLVFLNISFLLVAASALLIVYSSPSELLVVHSFSSLNRSNQEEDSCKGLQTLDGYKAKCFYLKSHDPCFSQGYIDYLHFFYCNFERFPLLGHCLLFLWLLVLFYLLGNTASEYFCSSLESLSRLLKLSPAIAGVTLLSLGNGAPDVFSSLVSFMGSGTNDIGFNTVLGGASFVTCVVVGIISICVDRKQVRVSKCALVRDVCFSLLVLASLIGILVYGKINLWGAIGFSSMYVVYVIVVIRNNDVCEEDESGLIVPILNGAEKGESNCLEEGTKGEEIDKCCVCIRSSSSCCGVFMYAVLMPLYLPRRLTIPVFCEKRWSKPMAVVSVTLAPVFLSALWNPQEGSLSTTLVVYGIGLACGVTFGVLAYATTEDSSPPKGSLLVWLVGGFIMSVIWTYITAQELVALLVSLGYIFGISPSILGLTVLAWGNSLGDLITNLTLALKGGPEGAQVAITGCYAGPIFNILFGLGLSLVGSCWKSYQSSITIPSDPYLLETLGFLVAGLLWAVVVLPKRDMRLDGVLGGGLLVIYSISLSLRLTQTLGSFRFIEKIPN